jgi:putative ABC transport system ATP-binding protein
MKKLLEARNLSLQLPGRLPGKDHPIFKDQTFGIGIGERVALMGPSGVGKTLFLRSLCLLEPGVSGEILWKSKAISAQSIPEYRSRVIYVGQRSILPSRAAHPRPSSPATVQAAPATVQDAFEEVFTFRVNQNKKWNKEVTENALRSFGKSDYFLQNRVDHLSGGEKQLVHLLRAVSLEPDILCLDEPTSALDAETACKVETWLKSTFQGAWIWVTHQREQAQRIGTQVLDFLP